MRSVIFTAITATPGSTGRSLRSPSASWPPPIRPNTSQAPARERPGKKNGQHGEYGKVHKSGAAAWIFLFPSPFLRIHAAVAVVAIIEADTARISRLGR